MWEKLKATDDEVAQVMGHEIGHALANHTQERMSIAYSTSVGTQLAAIALGRENQTAVLMQQAAVLAIQLPNSRESEAEADQIGIELAARAGYDPAAAVSLWDKMGKLGGGTPPEFLSTHPSPSTQGDPAGAGRQDCSRSTSLRNPPTRATRRPSSARRRRSTSAWSRGRARRRARSSPRASRTSRRP